MWRLYKQFILRPLFRERLRTCITIAGIATGVAVVLAIRMANESSIRGFAAAVDSIAGHTTLEITTPGNLVDERRLMEVRWLADYGEFSPVLEGEANCAFGSQKGEVVRILGVDILRDRRLRDYRLVEFGPTGERPRPQDLLALLLDPHSVILTEKFARRHGIRLDDTVPLTFGARSGTFTVRGLLRDIGPARALDGNLAVMDIAAAQLALDSPGHVTRLDLRIREPRSIDETERAIAARLPAGFIIQRPASRGSQVEKMLEAFHFNLTALSYIALLVGLFLIYNTVSVSVIARREEIGALRAVGASRGMILGFFIAEALTFSFGGCVLALPLARLLAYGAVALTSTTVSVFYRNIVAAPPPLDAQYALLAFGTGLPLALAAGLVPANEASRISPASAVRGTDKLQARYRLKARHIWIPAAFLAAGGWLSLLRPIAGLPIFGFLSALAFMLGGASLTPAALHLLGRIGRQPVARLFGIEGLMAHANLAGSIPRLAISVAALALSLSMMVAIAVMISSFRETVIYWVGQTLEADLYISPALRPRAGTETTISDEALQAVRGIPSVEAVDRFRRLDVPYNGDLVTVGAGDFGVLAAHGNLLFKAPQDGMSALRTAIGRDAVMVSESFSLKHGLGPDDRVVLPTRSGDASFQIAGVYYDYSNDRGILVMDRATFVRHFGDLAPTSLSVYLRKDADPDRVRTEILSSLPEGTHLLVHTNAALRGEVLRVFDSTFAITYALELIAVLVAIMGVAATLFTLMLDRRRDLAVLRLIGAEGRQIRKMVVVEAALMGFASQGIGVAVGMVLSLLLVFVINVQSFGWTIQFHLPIGFLTQMSVLVLLATALAGIYPARRACRLRPSEEIAEE